MGTEIRPLIAGNWKMNGMRESLAQVRLIAESAALATGELDALICVPATLLHSAAVLAQGTPLRIGAQDCHHQETGAYTGDISARMIADSLGSHAIVGHSERRQGYREDNDTVRAKASAAHRAGLSAIICIGETEEDWLAGKTLQILADQLDGSVPGDASACNTIVAYEPVWAIGTGRTPSEEDIAAVHAFLRQKLVERLGNAGCEIRILYGGSVKPSNAEAILGLDEVNGALVGGASLTAQDFLAICRASQLATA